MGWIEKLHECSRPEAEPNSIWQCDDCSFIWIAKQIPNPCRIDEWEEEWNAWLPEDTWFWREPDEKEQRKIQHHLTAERNRHEALRKERLKNDKKLHRPSEDSRL